MIMIMIMLISIFIQVCKMLQIYMINRFNGLGLQ